MSMAEPDSFEPVRRCVSNRHPDQHGARPWHALRWSLDLSGQIVPAVDVSVSP